MMLNSSHLQSGMAVTAHSDQSDAIQRGEEALRIAREIGWRSGEAYALIMLGNYFGIRGAYSKAFSFAKMSLAVAQEIEHSQWITYSHYSLGTLYLDILAPAEARQHLEHALTLANQIGSRWWVTNVTGYLALTYFLENDLERAASLLATSLQVSADSFIGDGIKIDAPTLGQRLCWYAYAELALSRGDLDAALHIFDQLLTASPNLGNGKALPGLSKLYGKLFRQLNRF